MHYLDDRGTTALQIAIAKHFAPSDADRWARARFGADSAAATLMQKANIPGGTLATWSGLLDAPTTELLEAVPSVFDRLRGRRMVEANVPIAVASTHATAYFIAESKAAKVSPLAFANSSLAPKKVVALVVGSRRAVERGGPKAIATIRNDLLRATARATDLAFFGNAAAGTTADAGILNGVTTITHGASVEADVGALLSAYVSAGGDLATIAFAAAPDALVVLATSGMEGVGIVSGTLLGAPLFGSAALAAGTLVAFDVGQMLALDEGIAEFTVSDSATVEMSDAGTGATDTPVAMSQRMVSLFQTESVGIKLVRAISWSVAAGSVVAVDLT